MAQRYQHAPAHGDRDTLSDGPLARALDAVAHLAAQDGTTGDLARQALLALQEYVASPAYRRGLPTYPTAQACADATIGPYVGPGPSGRGVGYTPVYYAGYRGVTAEGLPWHGWTNDDPTPGAGYVRVVRVGGDYRAWDDLIDHDADEP